jgi:hypothetical protein
MSEITKLVLHCSDSPDNVDIGAAEIKRWHTTPPPSGRGWSDIGYHYVVRRSGRVESGRFENGDSVLEGKEIGAHVAGENSDSLGICWVGRTYPTAPQMEALLALVKRLMGDHGIPSNRVFGHYEFNPAKTCPNLDMDAFRARL